MEMTVAVRSRERNNNEEQESMTQEFPIATTSEAPQDEPLSTRRSWFGFKLVGDNVDRGTKASFNMLEHMKMHHFTTSIHMLLTLCTPRAT